MLEALPLTFLPAVGCELPTMNSSFNFELSTLNRLLATHFPATHTPLPQVAENAATLSPAFATLTHIVNHNSFACHSYRKHPGWGIPSFSVNSVHSALKPTRAGSPIDPFCVVRSVPASPLESILAGHPANDGFRGHTRSLSPLYATLAKNTGGGPRSPKLAAWRVILPRMTVASLRLLNVLRLNLRQPQPGSSRQSAPARDASPIFKVIGCCRIP